LRFEGFRTGGGQHDLAVHDQVIHIGACEEFRKDFFNGFVLDFHVDAALHIDEFLVEKEIKLRLLFNFLKDVNHTRVLYVQGKAGYLGIGI